MTGLYNGDDNRGLPRASPPVLPDPLNLAELRNRSHSKSRSMLFATWLHSLRRSAANRRARRSAAPMRLRVTRLEPRRVLNASPLLPVDPSAAAADTTGAVQADDLAVVIDAGSHANDGIADTFHIYRSGEGIAVSVDGHEVFSGTLDPSQSLAVQGSADADHLVVHLGTQGLPASQIDFDGGAGHDLLELRGSTSQVTHVVMPHGEGVTTAGGTAISYDGTEELHDVVNAAVRELRLEQVNSALITGSGQSGLRLVTDGFRLDMARPHEQLDVGTTGGVGTELRLHEFGNDLSFDVSVNADAQDAVSFSGDFDFRTSRR